MTKSENAALVITALNEALQTQHVSHVDVDVVLPPGAIVPLQPGDYEDVPDDEDDILDPTLRQYGGYTPLVKLLANRCFCPQADCAVRHRNQRPSTGASPSPRIKSLS